MPTRILNQAWRVLSRIYDPEGGRVVPTDIELDVPVQLVHDLSREAELGDFLWTDGRNAAASSIFTIKADNVHVGAGAIQQLLGVYANSANTGWALSAFDAPDPTEETVWVLNCSAMSDTTGITANAYILASPAPLAGGGAGFNRNQLLWSADGLLGGGNTDGNFAMYQIGEPGRHVRFPVPLTNKLLNNSQLEIVTNVSAAATIEVALQCIRLPVGIWPPGLG